MFSLCGMGCCCVFSCRVMAFVSWSCFVRVFGCSGDGDISFSPQVPFLELFLSLIFYFVDGRWHRRSYSFCFPAIPASIVTTPRLASACFLPSAHVNVSGKPELPKKCTAPKHTHGPSLSRWLKPLFRSAADRTFIFFHSVEI